MMRPRAFVAFITACVAFATGASAMPRMRVPLAPAWLRPAAAWENATHGARSKRALPPGPAFLRPRRPLAIVRNPSGAPYEIIDLGAPAGLVAPMPYAIDAAGDVAVQYCATLACAVGSGSAYVYVAAMARLVPLARFATAGVGYTPYAIDAAGDRVVGWATFAHGASYVDRPVMWTRTSALVSRIDLLDADPNVTGRAYGISPNGTAIVGTISTSPSVNGVPARFAAGGFALLPIPAGTGGDAFAVNDAGTATGDVEDAGVVFAGGTFAFFAFPTDPYSYPSDPVAIAENGDVAGNYYGAEPTGIAIYPVGYRYLARLGPPSAGVQTIVFGEDETTRVNDMNDRDELVGETEYNRYATFVGPYLDGTPLSELLPATTQAYPNPASALVTATAVNDASDVVGQAYRPDGSPSAFEMIPAPPGCTPGAHRPSCLGGRGPRRSGNR